MKDHYFNKEERAILKVLYEARRDMTILEIAEEAKVSWATVNKYLPSLVERGVILKLEDGKSWKKFSSKKSMENS